MKINNISATNPNFGHITKRTIDMVRSQVEGHKVTKNGPGHYHLQSDYFCFNSDELSKLYELSKRASKLEKSVIDTLGNDWEEENTKSIVVRSHCYGGGSRANISIFTIPISSIYEASLSDPKVVLETLERAVVYAEDTEKDPNAHEMYDEYGWHGGMTEYKASKYFPDGYGTGEGDIALKRIYDNTLNMRSTR